jgi:rhodanese-related sulfurtransferase
LLNGIIGAPNLSLLKFSYKQFSSERDLAEKLYHSIKNVIIALPNDVIVYPEHNDITLSLNGIKEGNFTTIGEEKESNPFLNKDILLNENNIEQFMELITKRNLIVKPRPYCSYSLQLNIKGYEFLDDNLNKFYSSGLNLKEFQDLLNKDCVMIDSRDSESFIKHYIPGSISITLKSAFEVLAGTVIKPMTRILLITEEGKEKETILRLLRIGYNMIQGYLKGGINTWINSHLETHSIRQINHIDAVKYIYNSNYHLLDVREERFFSQGVLPNCTHFYFSKLNIDLVDLPIPKDIDIYVLASRGFTALTAISILIRLGYDKLYHIEGGVNKLLEKGINLINIQNKKFLCVI